ncbi:MULTISPECIES: hypothetical protein [Bacillus cereus group]|uniref:hypothetical protein n=1 Tax=Bacillus cereus group TaxID=86661 RepID=UPI0005CF1A53|nr:MULTISPECIES: hypothetical protein [Bacillus cereus group]TBL05097.1 hypothetical protein EYB35_21755 [Bacillus paranthracis]
MSIFNLTSKQRSKPIFPIVNNKELSNTEIKFLIKKFQSRQKDLEEIQKNADIITSEGVEFHRLLKERFTDKLRNKDDLSNFELEILNAMFQEEGVALGEFMLISQFMNEENRNRVEHDLKQQDFEFVEGVGFIRIHKYH